MNGEVIEVIQTEGVFGVFASGDVEGLGWGRVEKILGRIGGWKPSKGKGSELSDEVLFF